RRTAAGGIERDKGVQQEGNIVPLDLQIALVYLRRKGKMVELLGLHLRTRRIVEDGVVLAVRDAKNLLNRVALRKLHYGVVELAASDEINVFAFPQRLLGPNMSLGPYKCDFEIRIPGLHLADQLHILMKPDRRCIENQKLVIACERDSLVPVHLVR